MATAAAHPDFGAVDDDVRAIAAQDEDAAGVERARVGRPIVGRKSIEGISALRSQ